MTTSRLLCWQADKAWDPMVGMSEPTEAILVRVPSLRSVEGFRLRLQELALDLPCDEQIRVGADSPLAAPFEPVRIHGKRIGNRVAIQPMEGWDGTTSGGATEEVRRRWRRFGESGAKLVCGGEAMAVRPDGRANPNQLICVRENLRDLAGLRELLVEAHRERWGTVDDLVIGFQLTHSGRFCKPWDQRRMEPRVAFRHPLLDRRFGVTSDGQVFTDDEIEQLIEDYVRAAGVARDAGADFVDIKHCHGYLLHEFLGAHTRPGRFGGSFENRTSILRRIVERIRESGNPIDIGVRLSAFDLVPYRPDPSGSRPGAPGVGVPEAYADFLPYRYGFGVHPERPVEFDLTEPIQFARLCVELGVKVLNLSAGSPYYNPHIQRPAAYPPSDGYRPPEDPLVGVARQVGVVRAICAALTEPGDGAAGGGLGVGVRPVVVGSAYSYLQEYLPQVAQAVVRAGWVDVIGLGRAVLSYPEMLGDAVCKGRLEAKRICRTFSDCTTAPRNGLVSGCYPLDRYYADRPEAAELKQLKRGGGQ